MVLHVHCTSVGKYVYIHRFSICVYDDLKMIGNADSDYLKLTIYVEVGKMSSTFIIA